MKLIALIFLAAVLVVVAQPAPNPDWPFVAQHAEEGKTHAISLWKPDGEAPRALLLAVENFAEPKFCVDPAVRGFCREHRLGIALVKGNPFGSHDPPEPAWKLLDALLQALEAQSETKGLAALPLIPFGHSAAGPWARNLAFHHPERVAAVVHFKSGQFQPPPWANPEGFRVPVLALNGQYEEFGPQGDHQPGADWQGQWHAMRGQLAALRAKGMRVALTVEPGGGHYSWSGRQWPVLSVYLRAIMQAIVLGPDPAGFHRYPNACLVENRAAGPDAAHIIAESGFHGSAAETWWFPDQASAKAWRDSLADMDLKRQRVRFQHVMETRWERDFIDPAKVFEPDGVHFRIAALLETGSPVSYDILTGSAEHLGSGRFRLIPPATASSPLKIRLRAWSEGDETLSYAERVAEIRRQPAR